VRILHLHPGHDTGGQSIGGKPILEAAGHEVRVLVHRDHVFGYPTGEMWSYLEPATLTEAWGWADLVVAHNDTRECAPHAERDPKPLIVHHHGTRFRRYPRRQYDQAAKVGALQVVSTVDLLTFVPSGGTAHWQPQNIDIPKMAAVRAEHYAPGEKVRVAHMPTNRAIKGTAHVLAAVRVLPIIELVWPRRPVPWETCLRMKATADIYADQFLLGYGNNAVEAWAMGIPVIAGAESSLLPRMRAEWGELPFYRTDYPHLVDDLRALALSADCRAEWAARGLAHVRRFHAPAAWLARFEELAHMAGA
jgi:hypothetical protein